MAKSKTTDEKIVEILTVALKDGDYHKLWAIADILNARGTFESKVSQLLQSLSN